MASTMVIKVKYGDTLRHFNARIDENGQLDLDMGGLRGKVFTLFSFPQDADITMTYIDEDGDVVTLVDDVDLHDAINIPLGADITLVYVDEDRDAVTIVDDDDLREAMRQRLKSFRIDVQMNDDRDCDDEYCSSIKNSQATDVVNVTSDVDVEMYPDYFDFDLLLAESSAVPASSNEYMSYDDFYADLVYPTEACFEMDHSEAIGGMMCHTGFRCGVCGCQPILGSRFKSTVIGDYSLCRICFTSWGNKTDYIRIDHPLKGLV